MFVPAPRALGSHSLVFPNDVSIMKKTSSRRRAGKTRKSQLVEPRGYIPMLDSNPTFNRTFRFQAGASTNNLIVSRGDMLNLMQLAITTGSGGRIIGAIKINWVELSVPPAATSASASMTWLSAFGKPKVVSVTSLGSAEIMRLRTRPPEHTTASFYSITGSSESEPLIGLDVPSLTLFDVNVSFTFQNYIDNAAAPVVTTSTKTLTTGIIYCAALDGVSTNVLSPLGMAQF
jgi:hypothetical protein